MLTVFDVTVVNEQQPVAAGLEAMIRNAAHQQLDNNVDDDDLPWLVSQESAPEDLLLELCDRGLYIDDLGHRKGPRRLLEKLADEHNYPEAILTLAKKLYTDSAESDDSFVSYVRRHADSGWMLESLSYLKPSSAEKETAYIDVANSHSDRSRFEQIREARRLEEESTTTNDTAAIERLFATREPRVWRALANNPAVSIAILSGLSKASGIKYAAEIRDLAQRNLSARKDA
jgi:hypothetical protein